MDIGKRLRELREAKGLSQGDIERRSRLLRSYISRVEGGYTAPSLSTLEKFAKALEVKPYQLLYDSYERRGALVAKRAHRKRKASRTNWQGMLLRNLVTEGYPEAEAQALVDLAAS